MYACVCVELDVAKPMLDTIFVGTSKEHGWFQSIEYEGNNTYCTYYGLLGHVVGLCSKKVHTKGKDRIDKAKETPGDGVVIKAASRDGVRYTVAPGDGV